MQDTGSSKMKMNTNSDKNGHSSESESDRAAVKENENKIVTKSSQIKGAEDHMKGSLEMTPAELGSLPAGSYLLIDLRERSEYEHGFIPGCVLWSPAEVLERAGHTGSGAGGISRNKAIVLYCKYGTVSLDLAEQLRGMGYPAYSLEGGYGRWALWAILQQAQNDDKRKEIEKGLQKKFHGMLLNPFARAIIRYHMISDGDRIAVCISGGKDSMLMAKLFQEFQQHGQFHFDLVFLCMDPGYNEANRRIIESNARLLGIPLQFFETSIFDTVYNIKSSPCYLCARMRRGYLYKNAQKLGCNKIALGHHFDDVIETALMGMLCSGQFNAMMPKVKSANFKGMELIRPLYFIREDDIRHWRDTYGLHFIQCACHFTDTCTSCAADGQTHSMRAATKNLIRQLKKTIPDVETNIFHSTENVSIDQILGYKQKGQRHSFLDHYDES